MLSYISVTEISLCFRYFFNKSGPYNQEFWNEREFPKKKTKKVT